MKIIKTTCARVLVPIVILAFAFSAFIPQVHAEEKPPLDDSSNSITINNGVIEVTIGEQHSHDWWYGGFDHLYLERFAVSYNGMLEDEIAVFSDEDFTITKRFNTITGDPDTWYKCVLEYEDIEIERWVYVPSVYDPSGQKWFSINYKITNIGDSDIDELIFFEGVDYDIYKDHWEDDGLYLGVPHPYIPPYPHPILDAVIGLDIDIGWPFVGFTCSNWPSDDYGVYDFVGEMWYDIKYGCSINHVDLVEAYDLGLALSFYFENIESHKSVILAFNFAFADEEGEIYYLLSDEVPCPVIPEFPMGTVTSVATPILALVTLALVRRNRAIKIK